MHVRVCVECGEEYRPGIAVCADCGGALEDRRDDDGGPAKPGRAEDEGAADEDAFTESVLSDERATELTEPADQLTAEGIACRIRPQQRRLADGTAHVARYRLMVAPEHRERALDVLGLAADEDVDAVTRPCPACATPIPAGAIDCAECGLAAGDDPHQMTCVRCGQWLEGPVCPDCGP